MTTASREKVHSLDSRGVSVRLPVAADKETASPPCTTSRDIRNSSTAMTRRARDEIHSNREMTSLPCMASGSLSKGPAAVWTGDNSVEETAATERIRNEEIHEPLNKGNGKNNLNKAQNAHRVVNDLSVPTIDKETSARKKGNTVFASVSTSSATRVKCSKNED